MISEHLDKLFDISFLIFVSLSLRVLFEFIGQRWITTFAHTATLVILPVITYVIVKVISGNIALSLGMVGALSIVRFRNPVRSPLELSIYFAAISLGIAVSVNIIWAIFLVGAIYSIFILLWGLNIIYKFVLRKEFFNASFSEGNSLSSLEITVPSSLDYLDNCKLLKSKFFAEGRVEYLLVSEDFKKLQDIINFLNFEDDKITYSLNK